MVAEGATGTVDCCLRARASDSLFSCPPHDGHHCRTTDTTQAEPSVVMTTSQLESALTDGPWSSGSYASSANCIENDVRADGSGTYQCYVYWTDGSAPSSRSIVVSPSGGWMTAD